MNATLQPDVKPATPDNHDQLFQDGIKLLEDAASLFISMNTPHGAALMMAIHSAIALGTMVFDANKK